MRLLTRFLTALVLVLVGCLDSDEIDDDDDGDEPEIADEPGPIESADSTADDDLTAPPTAEAADRFGVRMIYPTVSGGREWFLPANAQTGNAEWSPSNGSRGRLTATGEAGVFRVKGGPRLPVKPGSKAWFRNVEVTAYYRYRRSLTGDDEISPLGIHGFQILVRGGAHLTGKRPASGLDRPPAGTVAGPGYPFSSGQVNAHCIAASLHGYADVDGRVRFKKEISHTAGYTGGKAEKKPFPGAGPVPTQKWFGYKLIVRNQDHDRSVHMEIWMDLEANGNWKRITQLDDTGGWGPSGDLDGCGGAPFRYRSDQRITWAGPNVYFRFDNLETDVKWMSAREIAPL